ncbi:MAG TPA: HAMP domain-containing sensor histidine kinase, partial [Candidatus Omnitrophota bacterium]|nr:HAMP domain-containing sensor histidine kinase [Candidatus Omnitrophota bacterium]
ERYGERFRSKDRKMDMLFGCLSIPAHDNCPEQVLGVMRADCFPSGESLLPKRMNPEALLDIAAIVCNAAAQSLDELRIRTELEKGKIEAQAQFVKAQGLMRRMKHDFSSSLTVPSGYIQMLLRDSLSDEQRKGVTAQAHEAIKKIAARLERYSDQIRSGNFDIVITLNPTNIKSIFRALREIRYDIEIDEKVPETIITDESHVKEVLYGLIENAKKYTDGDPGIKIACKMGNGRFVISVSDRGKGLTPEQRKKIFDGGVRFHPHIPGSGFGLYGFRKIIEKMGGEIWAESEGMGKGSTFSFTLPL